MSKARGLMIAYLVIVVTSVLVGLVAALLWRPNGKVNAKAFLVGALLNAAAVLGILVHEKRNRR